MGLEAEINKALGQTKKELVDSYNSKKLRASGKYEKDLETYFNETPTGYNFGILGAKHAEYMQNGRLQNRNQDRKALKRFVGWAGSTFLKQWVKDKGLNISPFAVAWKLAIEGSEVPNQYNKGGVISDVINDSLTQRFIDAIKFAHIESMKSDVRKILSNGNN